ncbi:MAG: OB-fold domain-containing protein [Acidimicrobiales bacterium]
MAGLVAYGAYVPCWRLERTAIASALGGSAGRGTRSVASYDEDSTSMAVEAGRAALASAPDGWRAGAVVLATSTPAYQDKTNATAVHSALGLPDSAGAYDFAGSARSAGGALRFARTSSIQTLVVASDMRTGLPGGPDESGGGDAAVALVFGDGPALVEVLGEASSSDEFLDRWRTPGDQSSRVWEERFGESVYVPLAQAAVTEAFKSAGITAEEVDHLVVTGLHARAARAVAAWVGARNDTLVDDLTSLIGNTGAAHPGLLLAAVLDRAAPGDLIAVVHLADGADATVYRATEALAAYRRSSPAPVVADLVASGRPGLPYATFLTWRGQLRREPPRRPDPEAPAAPPSRRNERWKFAFTASRCDRCGTRHLPPARVCHSCHAADAMSPEHLAGVGGTIATFTVDRLAFSLSPPVVAAVIDFDGGGRYQCEMADVDPAEVEIGKRVAMTFRRLYTAGNGVHDYFWKARLATKEPDTKEIG